MDQASASICLSIPSRTAAVFFDFDAISSTSDSGPVQGVEGGGNSVVTTLSRSSNGGAQGCSFCHTTSSSSLALATANCKALMAALQTRLSATFWSRSRIFLLLATYVAQGHTVDADCGALASPVHTPYDVKAVASIGAPLRRTHASSSTQTLGFCVNVQDRTISRHPSLHHEGLW